MNEKLLQYIWQFQYFNKSELQTEQQEQLTIIHQGKLNTNQGPDFLDAKVVIGGTTWAGNIELHIHSSDWNKHNHSSDKNYSNIILHVVWIHDADICSADGSVLPTLIMQPRVSALLLARFSELMLRKAFVPCESYLPVLDQMKWLAWKERLAVERIQRKSIIISTLLAEANNHWEEVFWWMLARNFGVKVNADVFETIAKSIPINVLGKHKNQIHQVESLLFGQAGLLEGDFEEDYPKMLQKEYVFYAKKYQLRQPLVAPFFLRMRPANFPTLRLAQLAMLIHNSSHLFSKVKEAPSVESLKELLNVAPNDYWLYHYLFDQPKEYKPKPLGNQMVENIIINTIIPVLFAYGNYYKDDSIKEKALQWLSLIHPESNAITNKWVEYKVENNNALESQALIELKNNYCDTRRCLECVVGNAILKGNNPLQKVTDATTC